ncbi:hypothetical protein DFP73DRAFT_269027 [Morchella snyderi]|nr:hypothetical protein DFP73DRAFT_269027 [Morchella snyderi]
MRLSLIFSFRFRLRFQLLSFLLYVPLSSFPPYSPYPYPYPYPSLSGGGRQWAFFLGSSTSEMYVCNKALRVLFSMCVPATEKANRKRCAGIEVQFSIRICVRGYKSTGVQVRSVDVYSWQPFQPPSKREHVDTLLRVTTGKQPIVEEGGQGSDLRLQ